MDSHAEIERVYRERFAVYVGAVAGIVGSRELARDVVQDGFARALAHEARFRGGSLEAWIEAWIPRFLFSVLFGPSMDYHVFRRSRIRERFDTTGNTEGAIVHGISSSARLITAPPRS